MMEILLQRTQDNESIFLVAENMAVCESGKILYYDDLGHLHDTNFECILEDINQNTDVELIKNNIIDLENIVVGFEVVDLVNFKINRKERFKFLNENLVAFREYTIDLVSLEVPGEMQDLEEYLEKPTHPQIHKKTAKKIKAIVNAIYRKNIENFVDFKNLQKILERTHKPYYDE